MEPPTRSQMRALVITFLDRYDAGTALLPDPIPFPYNPVPAIETVAWMIPFVEVMVAGELSELTNLLNQWMGALRRWHAWNDVLAGLTTEDRWETEWEFVEPLAFMCMFQPSATRDRFIFVATNALHQIRLVLEPASEDKLLGDPKPPDFRQRYPTRREKEGQLRKMAESYAAGSSFMDTLASLDDDDYQAATSGFRNRSSHAIGPRFSVGVTAIVVRECGQKTMMEKQPDGRFIDVPVPGETAVRYGYGGTPALGMQEARAANLAQFEAAKRCFLAYVELLREATARMPQRRRDGPDKPV